MDIQQPVQQQPSEQPINQNIQPTPVVTRPPQNNWKIIVLVVVGVLVLGGISYGAYYFWPKDNQPVVAPTTDKTAKEASSLISIDQTWNLYTNNKHGFSIKMPKKIYSNTGSMCEWKNNSYQPKGGFVSVKIFENTEYGLDNVYIAREYFYNLTGVTIENVQPWLSSYSKCEKIMNTASDLAHPSYYQRYWKFVIKNINNDSELDTFIKEQYGSGCRLGNKVTSIQEGVYDIDIQGDGKELNDTKCYPIGLRIIKYYPVNNKAITWALSMDGFRSAFPSDENDQVYYDEEMFDSFRFK